jgi:hypothetical protein
MDPSYFEEVVSILAMVGRPDLIQELKEHVKIDEDYKPPNFVKKEKLSDSEGSATSESDYDVEVDEDGFQSLK